MKKINLELFKNRVINIAKQATNDFCNDMYKDLKSLVDDHSLDEAKILIDDIQMTNKTLNDQIKYIEQSQCVMGVLDATIYNDARGNVLFEAEDIIFDAMYYCYELHRM